MRMNEKIWASALAAFALAAVASLAASCSTTSTRETTALALDNILAGGQRSAENSARDRYRHPKDTLLFFGIRPEMTVLEVWPEPGWYTEIIAPLVRERGKYYAAVIAPDPQSKYVTARRSDYQQKLASKPDVYGSVAVGTFPGHAGEVVPPGSLDMALTCRIIHNWLADDSAS